MRYARGRCSRYAYANAGGDIPYTAAAAPDQSGVPPASR
jgi:hypothetical protein